MKPITPQVYKERYELVSNLMGKLIREFSPLEDPCKSMKALRVQIYEVFFELFHDDIILFVPSFEVIPVGQDDFKIRFNEEHLFKCFGDVIEESFA